MNGYNVEFVDEPNTHRLLAAAHFEEPAIAPLYDTDTEKAILDRLEARSSARLMAQNGRLDELDEKALLTEKFGYGWTFVNAAFAYTRAGGNRFNRESRGAWYAAIAVETCLREVAFHLGRELENTRETENVTRYVDLVARIAGPMACLLGYRDSRCLHPDPAIGYPEGQEFAARIRENDLAGIRYPSVRHLDGVCLAALSPSCIKRVTPGPSYVLSWTGGRGPQVDRT